MTQTILVIVLAVFALFYLGRKLYRSASGKSEGCEKCAANEIVRQRN